jgi:hypothetical protein
VVLLQDTVVKLPAFLTMLIIQVNNFLGIFFSLKAVSKPKQIRPARYQLQYLMICNNLIQAVYYRYKKKHTIIEKFVSVTSQTLTIDVYFMLAIAIIKNVKQMVDDTYEKTITVVFGSQKKLCNQSSISSTIHQCFNISWVIYSHFNHPTFAVRVVIYQFRCFF